MIRQCFSVVRGPRPGRDRLVRSSTRHDGRHGSSSTVIRVLGEAYRSGCAVTSGHSRSIAQAAACAVGRSSDQPWAAAVSPTRRARSPSSRSTTPRAVPAGPRGPRGRGGRRRPGHRQRRRGHEKDDVLLRGGPDHRRHEDRPLFGERDDRREVQDPSTSGWGRSIRRCWNRAARGVSRVQPRLDRLLDLGDGLMRSRAVRRTHRQIGNIGGPNPVFVAPDDLNPIARVHCSSFSHRSYRRISPANCLTW